MAKLKTEASIVKKINEHNAAIKDLKLKMEEMKKTEKSLKTSQATLIADDLCLTKPGLPNSNMFSYKEIAERHGVSVSRVQKVAEDNGIKRKDTKIS